MRIGILFEGSPKKPGGFYQSLQSATILKEIKDDRMILEFICLENETSSFLKKKNFNVRLFSNSYYKKLFNFFMNFQFFNNLILNYKLEHPFSTFLKKNDYDLIIFLSPSVLAYHCGKINFIMNIWDLDHKKNSPFPEHRVGYNFLKREYLINYVVFHGFKTVVADEKTKEELINIYNCDESKLIVQPFIPYLPQLYEDIKKDHDFKKIFNQLDLPDKRIILYPATFWAHKNHKYLIDAAKIFKDNDNNDYIFIFCGGGSSNLDFIKNEINKYGLEDTCLILPLISDLELISLYLNSHVIAMPTTGGPTNLPLYESFYFKKIIFYSKHLIFENKLSDNLITVDIDKPAEFCEKIINLNENQKKLITEKAFEFYKTICSFKNFKKTYLSIIEDFISSRKKWK